MSYFRFTDDHERQLWKFGMAWRTLERGYQVDAAGSMQWRRISYDWLAAGCPDGHIINFIMARVIDSVSDQVSSDDNGGEL